MPPTEPAPFPVRLKLLRAIAGLSQRQLADRSGVKIRTIQDYEYGRGNPSWSVIQALADALGVKTDALR